MFKSKLEVDRHVNNSLKNINSDTQRCLRGYSFAKLYFSVGDYEQACRYVKSYLSVKPKSAEAYVLLGKCLEKLTKVEAALDAYRNALEIEPKHNKVIIKVCELMASDNADLDLSGARYFCDLAQSFDPSNSAVYCLKEKLISKGNENPSSVIEFLLGELELRPTDINLRIRLLRNYLQNNMVLEAYKHASAVEEKHFFILSESLSWYEVVAEVLHSFQKEQPSSSINTWEFLSLSISVLEKLIALGMEEYHNNVHPFTKYIAVLFEFDQSLCKAYVNRKSFKVDLNLLSLFFKHYQAQLYFHAATLMFKQAKRNDLESKEGSNSVLPLLFVAYHADLPDLNSMWLVQLTEKIKKLVYSWHNAGCYRNSQMGHIILEAAKSGKSWLFEKVVQYSSGSWRENLFRRLFVSREYQLKITTSFFVSNVSEIEPTLKLPYLVDLLKYDENALAQYPDSLHHYIWVTLNNNIPDINISTFKGLQYSSTNLTNCGPEALNLLDIYSYVYCASLCANTCLKDNKYRVCGFLPPASIIENLATLDQLKFLKAAYKIYKNDPNIDPSERVLLTKGIETVRCMGHHGLDVKLLVLVAGLLEERAKKLALQSEIDLTLSRSELYWSTAIPLLEKVRKDGVIAYPKKRMFEYQSEKVTPSEIQTFLDKGKLFIATQQFKKRDYEKALNLFSELRDPYASYYQFEIYKALAEEEKRENKNSLDNTTDSYEIFLNKARDSLYLTLDRLRSPVYDSGHPLNSIIGSEIRDLENLISGRDGRKLDFNDSLTTLDTNKTMFTDLQSTPLKLNISRQEARPSPERLDAQIRQIMATKDASVSLLSEQNKAIVDTQKNILDKLNSVIDDLRGLRTDIDNLKETTKGIDDVRNTKDDILNMVDVIREIKKDLNEVKKNDAKNNQLSEEDLYALDADYGVDYNIAATIPTNIPGTYPTYPGGRIPNPNHIPAYGPSLMYPGLYSGLSYNYPGFNFAQPGSLPFLPEQQPSAVVPTTLHLPNMLASPIGSKFGVDLRKPQPSSQSIQLSKEEQPTPAVPSTIINQLKFTSASVPAVSSLVTSSPAVPLLNPSSSSVPSPIISSADLPSVVPPSTVPSLFTSSVAGSPFSTSSPTVQPLIPAAPGLHSTIFGKAPPVNVVITTSDPLPSKDVVTSQPVLSVTIPPQHMKSNFSKFGTTSSLVTGSPLITSSNGDSSLSNQEKYLDKSRNLSSASINSLENEEPNIEFKPIIPLPDEVPFITGEENEKELFNTRAKLFRHVNTNGIKEWKERGVGILKILQNQQTGKYRILMRRDQVLKICANHFIRNDFTLVSMPNNDKSFMWIAHDFSEGELQIETFCVKFKNAEEAKQFEEVVKKVKSAVQIKDQGTPEPKQLVSNTEKPASTLFQPPASTSLGGFVFTGTPTFKPKEIPPITSTPEQPPEPVKHSSPFSTFVFGKDNKKEEESKMFSPVVISQEKKDEAGVEEFEPTAEFKPVVPLPELVATKTGEENCKVLFSAKTKLFRYAPDLKEWKERGVGIIKILKDQDQIRLLMRRDQVHKVCCNHRVLKDMIFKPNSSKPQAIVWHAKDFSDEELKAETFTARFKTEESANEFLQILQDAQKSMNENNLITGAKDNLYGLNKKSSTQTKESKPEIGFGDRFKLKAGVWECKSCLIINEASAQNCVACNTSKDGTAPKPLTEQPLKTYTFGINTNASKSANESKPAVGFGETFKAKPGSWECKTCLIRNEETVQECAACNTPKDGALPQTKATAVGNLKLNPLSTFAFGFNANPVKPEKEKKPEVGFGDTFKAQPGSWECKACLIRNEANVQKCVACDTIKEGATLPAPTPTATSTVTSKWTFGLSNASPSNGNQEPKTLFGSNATDTKSLFSKTPAPAFFFGSSKTDEPKTNIFGDASAVLSGKNSSMVDSKWSFGQQSISIPSPNTVNQDKITPVKANLDNSESSGSFVFGSGQKEDFEFKQRTPRRISSGPGNEESDGSYVEEEEDTIYFKPIIPLPDKIQIKTGEENEDVLYCHRAKLYRFVGGEWKERGIGDVKILKNKSSQKLRVVMRREQVLKICLNHILSKDIEYIPKDDRSFMFATADFADGELVNEQFCLRFKNSEIANEFKKAVSDALGGATQKTKVSEPATESDDEVIITHETHVTPEEEKLAISLGLPPKFMSYKQLPDCTCEQCKKDDEYLKDLFDASSDANTVKNTFSFASQSFALKPSVLASKSVMSKPPSDSTPTPFSFASTNNPEFVASNSVGKPFSSNSSIFGTGNSSAKSFTFKAFPGDPNNLFSSIPNPNTSSVSTSTKPFQFETKATFGTPSMAETKNIFADALSNSTVTGSKNIFGGAVSNSNVTVSKNIFAEPLTSSTQISTSTSNIGTTNIFADPFSSGKTIFSNVASSVPPKPEDTLPNKEKEIKELVFKCDSGLSFASLAAATTSDAKPAFSKKADDAFLFLGAGAPVFGSQKSKLATDPNASQNEDDCDNSNAEAEYDPHYEPIVPLPDQIVVTTGEEDEDILFNDRAKLFRYDTNTKEWKERGIGQLKVLHHRQKNTYRLLLRREQVYKIVLNQLLTTNFELQQMLTSNKAWMWAGNNFIEGEYCLEKLAVRFKNDELAVQFKAVIDNVVAKLQTVPLKEQEDIPLYVQNYEVEHEDDDVDGEEVEEESYKDENDINEEYIEEEEDDEDERTIMFMKECILSELSSGNEWHPVGQGDLQVYYDPELYAARIQVSDHTGKILSSTIIGVNTLMDIDGNECTWKATEWAATEIQWRNLKATFDSEPSAQEFHSNYLESLNYAQQVGLIDDLPDVFEPEN